MLLFVKLTQLISWLLTENKYKNAVFCLDHKENKF